MLHIKKKRLQFHGTVTIIKSNFVSVSRLQPNVDTRQKQLAAWCSLVLSYCRHHKLYTLDVMEAQESPVFNNKKIERILVLKHPSHSFTI